MKSYIKRISTLFISLLLLVTPLSTVTAQIEEKPLQNLSVNAKAAIAIDAKTGQILFEQNSNEKLPIASMTKMISMAVVSDAVKAGKLSWDQALTVTPELAALSTKEALSNVPLKAGQSYTVKSLYEASVIASANATTMVLADAVAGNQEAFIQKMQEKLKSWGISDAKIVSSTGLPNSDIKQWQLPNTTDTDENEMTAKDMAIVSQHIVNDYPEFIEASKQASFTFNNETYHTFNRMLEGQPVATSGVDGLKTGTTDAAGPCFAGTIVKNNWRIVTVVMNASPSNDKNCRFVETKKIMNAVYETYQPITLKKGTTVKGYTSTFIENATTQKQTLVLKKDYTYIATKNGKVSLSTFNKKDHLEAPLNKGTTVRTLQFHAPYGYINSKQVPKIQLVLKHNVNEASIWRKIARQLNLTSK